MPFNSKSQRAYRFRCLLAIGLIAHLGVFGCSRFNAPPSAARPAEKPKNEAALAYTTLSAGAHKSLQIEALPANNALVQEHLQLTGWIMAKLGNEVAITAPVSGFVRQSNGLGKAPFPGAKVAAGDELMAIEPVLSPVEKIQLAMLERTVQNELTKAHNSLKVAEQELRRLETLYKDGLRGEQEVDQARLKRVHAEEDLKAAQDKEKLFQQSSIAIGAPRAGTVLTVSASPGQYVTAAAPLLTLADLSELWIRVPVPEYDVAGVNGTQPVLVTLKSPNGGQRWSDHFIAQPIGLAPKVDPLRHTADLHYRLAPFSLAAFKQRALFGVLDVFGGGLAGVTAPPMTPTPFVKDQMVTVHVPVGRLGRESVAPYAAVVFDAFGGAWIYLERAPTGGDYQYERRRVELGPAVAGGIVVRPSLSPADRVVTAGAAVLYSREFHKPPVADDSD